MAAKETLTEFNERVARDVKALHDRLHEAGFPVSPEEAKFWFCVGWAATADLVGHEEGRERFVAKAREFAEAAEESAKRRAA